MVTSCKVLFELFELSPVNVESCVSVVDCDGGSDSEQLSLSAVPTRAPVGRWPFWFDLLFVCGAESVAEVDLCCGREAAILGEDDDVAVVVVHGSEVVQS